MSWLRSGYGGEKAIAFLSTVLLVGQSEGFQAPDAAMRLTNEDLYFLFGDQEAPPHSLVNIRSKSREKRSTPFLTENPGLLDVTLEDEGQEVEFELRLNHEVVSPDFLLVVRDTNGVTEERGLGHPSCLYYGTAKGKPDTVAALSNCDGHGFTGVIVSGNQSHLLRPLNHRRRRRQSDSGDDLTPEGFHVIHTRREGAKCGVFDIKAMTAPRYIIELPTTEEPNGHSITKRAVSSKGQIETAVFVDDDMYNVIKKANPSKDVEETVKDVVFTIMNGVHMLYNAPSLDKHFTITLVRVEIIKSSTKGPSKAGGDIHKYLGTFCSWQKDLNRKAKAGEAWDHALMLSGLDLFDGNPKFDTVIGLAWVSGMCHPLYSCTINEGTSFEAVYVIAHEMGHNLGMAHDGENSANKCNSEKFLMSASTGPGKVTWSDCSNKELKTFLSKAGTTCLVNRGRGPRLLEFADDDLPGVKYTKEKQCSFVSVSRALVPEHDPRPQDTPGTGGHHLWPQEVMCQRAVCAEEESHHHHSVTNHQPTHPDQENRRERVIIRFVESLEENQRFV